MESKRPRGPIGKSCLTCKRRHKKCDQNRPKCIRCVKGGYECSYEHNEKACSRRTQQRKQPTENYSPNSNDTLSPLCNEDNIAPEYSSMEADTPMPTDVRPPQVEHSESTMQVATNQLFSPFWSGPTSSSDLRIPPSLALLPLGSWRLINYIMAQYDRILESAYFKPIQSQMVQYRSTMILQLQSSSITRRTKLVSFKICEAITSGEDWRYQNLFKGWAQLLERELCASWEPGTTSQASECHLGGALEVSLIKSMLADKHDAYEYLRYMVPTFLRTVFSDASLWSNSYELSAIPISRVLASPRCELGRFIFMDTMYSMAYGLPQFINYDTSMPAEQDEVYGCAWSHGCPVAFQVVLADINMCRDKLTLARGWQEIERSLLSWEPQYIQNSEDWESWMTIAWLAVQESWRHTLLVYLYLAAGDLSSDDPRVQNSVRQIFQIVKTVKQPERPQANVQLFAQYFIVGVCARTEKDRRIVRDKLANAIEFKAWMAGGADFVPVLEHLWCGAALGGRPIKWSDYVNSREKVLPVLQ